MSYNGPLKRSDYLHAFPSCDSLTVLQLNPSTRTGPCNTTNYRRIRIETFLSFRSLNSQSGLTFFHLCTTHTLAGAQQRLHIVA